MLKKILVVVGLAFAVSNGIADANPISGTYLWNNLHFKTTCEMKITEEKFFGRNYIIDEIKDNKYYLTVYELGERAVPFILEKEDGNVLVINRMGNSGRFQKIAIATKKG
jgi:hypothetical protein